MLTGTPSGKLCALPRNRTSIVRYFAQNAYCGSGLASLGYRGASTLVLVAILYPRRAADHAFVATGATVEMRRK